MVNGNHRPSRPFALVRQLAYKLAPTGIGYRLCQLRVADHVLNLEGFNTHNLVFVNQCAGQLVQAVLSAIGDFGVNTGNLGFGLGAIGGAEFLFTQAALGAGKQGCVFCRVTGIADLVSIAGYKQVFYAEINADHFWCDGQDLGIELAQAGDEVSPCGVFGNGNSAGLARQRAAPADSQGLLALCHEQLPVPTLKGGIGQGGRLFMVFALEGRILGSTFKEVFEGGLLVTQGLLERDAGHVIKPCKFGFFLECSQLGASLAIADFFLFLIEGIGTPAQDVVIDKSRTAKRLGKQLSLFRCWVETVFVGALCHVLQLYSFNARCQLMLPRLYPRPRRTGFYAHSDKSLHGAHVHL